MKNTITIWIASFFLIVSTAQAQFAGGSGTEGDPYQVATLEQLQEVGNHIDSHFIMTADIDASDTQTWNDGKGFMPIAPADTFFTGSFDGDGYVISDLTIFRQDDDLTGLFRKLSGTIKNVSLENASITGFGKTGGLVGRLVGGVILNSSVSGNVSGERRVGCLVGINDTGEITESYASCNASGGRDVGGLVGDNKEGSIISKSYATGNVSTSTDLGKGHDAGGLVGANTGHIYDSYATGFVSPAKKRGGGLAGQNEGASAVISNSYATGMVNCGDIYCGGLVGRNRGGAEVITSFSAGAVYGTDDPTTGGFMGGNVEEAVVTTSYWDTETSGFAQGSGVGEGTSDGMAGLTTAEMTGAAAADNMGGFDFTEIWATSDDGYPMLYWEDGAATSIDEPGSDLPERIVLGQNYPNPFNPSTEIRFELPQSEYVRLQVFSATGQLITTLLEGRQSAGQHAVSFSGEGLASGIYLYRIEADNFAQTKKMLLVK